MGAHGKQCTCKTCLVVWHLGPVKRTRKTRKKGAEEWCPLHAKVPEMRVLLELLTKDHLNDNGECQFFHVGRRRRKPRSPRSPRETRAAEPNGPAETGTPFRKSANWFGSMTDRKSVV